MGMESLADMGYIPIMSIDQGYCPFNGLYADYPNHFNQPNNGVYSTAIPPPGFTPTPFPHDLKMAK
jgi:hypothetical protein